MPLLNEVELEMLPPPPPPPITPDLKKLMFHYRYIKNKVNYEIKNANISY